MKKSSVMILLLSLVIPAHSLLAAVSGYTFGQTTGVYTSITGGTVIGGPSDDDTVSGGLPIGFSFTYNGTAYTQFGINSNGWISLGGAVPTSSWNPISAGVTNNVISAMGMDLILGFQCSGNTTLGSPVITFVGDTSGVTVGAPISGAGIPAGATVVTSTADTITISAPCTVTQTGVTLYLANGEMRVDTLGSAPARVCVIQWSRTRRSNDACFTLSFQIRLLETSNIVEVAYGPIVAQTGCNAWPEVGLRGASNADFNNRSLLSGSWTATTAGAANDAICLMNSPNYPASGLTFRWGNPLPVTLTRFTVE